VATLRFDDDDELKGWYPCTVEAAEEETSKNGNLMFKLSLRPVGKDGDRYDYVMLSGKAAKWHSKKLKAILGNTEDFEDGEEVSPMDLVQRRVWVCFCMEPYQGRMYPKVDNSQGECGYEPESYCAWPAGEGTEFDPDDPEIAERFGEPKEGFDDPEIPF
jgi:hypothetical protein